MKRSIVVGAVSILFSILFWGTMSYAQGGDTSSVEFPYNNCRFGITIGGGFSPFNATDLQQLNAGWYVNWHAVPSTDAPPGLEHTNVIRLQANLYSYTSTPTQSELPALVAANPGQIWFIGNEPDSIFQDTLWATIYADAYYDLYHIIKTADPTAQVGIGAVVQPTPLRFQYLDIIWNTYRDKYGVSMPVDVWNIHSFILREERGTWGAFIPPGPEFSDIDSGILYDARDMDNISIFRQRLIDFRQWMAAHGQREKPLYITEYGVLWPESYSDEDGDPFSQTRVGNFMTASFDAMRGDTDEQIGYPYDDNRLVQRWAWFSIDGSTSSWGGSMFDRDTGAIRYLGQVYQNYTAQITPTVTTYPAKTTATATAQHGTGSFLMSDFLLTADISNSGNISNTQPITVTFFEGTESSVGAQIGVSQIITNSINGCGGYKTVSVTWTNVLTGANPYFVQVETEEMQPRRLSGVALVATNYVYLPLVMR